MDKKELYSTLEELRTGMITSDMAMEQILLLFSVSDSLPNKCTCWGGNVDCFSGKCTICENRKDNGI